MKKLLIATGLILLVVSCGPSAMRGRIERAYERGQLTEAQYLQLRMQEQAIDDAENQRIIDLLKPKRAGGTRY